MKLFGKAILDLGWREYDSGWISPSGGLRVRTESLATLAGRAMLAAEFSRSISRMRRVQAEGPDDARQEMIQECTGALQAIVAQTPQLGYWLYTASGPSVPPVAAIDAVVRGRCDTAQAAAQWSRHLQHDLRVGFWIALDWFDAGFREVEILLGPLLLVEDHTSFVAMAERELHERGIPLLSGASVARRDTPRDRLASPVDVRQAREAVTRVRSSRHPERELDLALGCAESDVQRSHLFRFNHGGNLSHHQKQDLLQRAMARSMSLAAPARAELLMGLARASDLTPRIIGELALEPSEFPGEFAYALSRCSAPVSSSDIEKVAALLPVWSAAQEYLREARLRASVLRSEESVPIWTE